MDQPYPMPGDAVRLTRDWSFVKAGQIAIIGGVIGERRNEYLICFAYSAFRGPNSKYSEDRTEFVSCSGGPAPYIPTSVLRPTGQLHNVTFWRWIDLPRADGGQNYQLDVPLWEWDGIRS
jgi:hypothetical protein